jgi:predicted nucleic acid-binding Zn ribbon protein
MNTHCKSCGKEIKVMAFIGKDWCSDNCRKDLAKEEDASRYGSASG